MLLGWFILFSCQSHAAHNWEKRNVVYIKIDSIIRFHHFRRRPNKWAFLQCFYKIKILCLIFTPFDMMAFSTLYLWFSFHFVNPSHKYTKSLHNTRWYICCHKQKMATLNIISAKSCIIFLHPSISNNIWESTKC